MAGSASSSSLAGYPNFWNLWQQGVNEIWSDAETGIGNAASSLLPSSTTIFTWLLIALVIFVVVSKLL